MIEGLVTVKMLIQPYNQTIYGTTLANSVSPFAYSIPCLSVSTHHNNCTRIYIMQVGIGDNSTLNQNLLKVHQQIVRTGVKWEEVPRNIEMLSFWINVLYFFHIQHVFFWGGVSFDLVLVLSVHVLFLFLIFMQWILNPVLLVIQNVPLTTCASPPSSSVTGKATVSTIRMRTYNIAVCLF